MKNDGPAASPSLLRRVLHWREGGILLALVALVAGISLYEPQFATLDNLYMVSRQIAYTAIVALGVFVVILTGGIDLSIGSVVGLSGVMTGLALAGGVPPAVAVVIGLATGAAVGAVNATIISYVGVTSFIVTLGMLSAARGAVLVITHGDSIRNIPEGFIRFGGADVARLPGLPHGISMAVAVLAVVAVGTHVVLTRTVFGRRLYAIGGNEEATALSGINTRRVKFAAYIICSMLSSVTGILFIARFRSAQANAGDGMALDAIAAAVIGGTSLMGGQGTVAGVLIGATIMGVLRNGLVLMQVSSYWQELIIGTIIVLAAIVDVVRSRRRRA